MRFDTTTPLPKEGETFAVDTEVADCPWDPEKQLLQVGVRAADGDGEELVAENVRMAVEFNPATVSAYRLIGHTEEEAQPADPQSADVPSGHTVTALYEVVPRASGTDDSQPSSELEELGTVRVDFKETGRAADQSVEATVAEVQARWRLETSERRYALRRLGCWVRPAVGGR